MAKQYVGKIKFYDSQKGFGIIECGELSSGVYFFKDQLEESNYPEPRKGWRTVFELLESGGKHQGKLKAIIVSLTQPQTTSVQDTKSYVFWRGRAYVGQNICNITVNRKLLEIEDPGLFRTDKIVRQISRVTAESSEGIFSDRIILRGGGPTLELRSCWFGGNLRELASILNSR